MYNDVLLNQSKSGTTETIKDVEAFMQAVKFILLTKPGTFPFRPELGMNIAKYQFEYADDDLIREIRNELDYQISKYLPGISSLSINIEHITDNNGNSGIGIIMQSYLNNQPFTSTLAILQKETVIDIISEIF